MFKTISAALLAVSVLAAPAMAAGTGKLTADKTARTTQAPAVDKSAQMKPKAVQTKAGLLNANAKMGGHHRKHIRHHRAHKHVGALKSHQFSKASIKHATPALKRG
jgi:hypothetical protein